DLDAFWEEVGLVPTAANGPCVRSVKVCPGKTYCKIGLQETLELGLELEKRYSGLVLPSKFKIGVSGCPNSCTEPVVKDLGFMGTKDGFTCFVGGSAGRNPRFAEVLAEGLNAEQCLEVTEKIIGIYRERAKKGQRLGKFIGSIGGIDEFRKLVL
ncbi:MAG: NAD(P)/FAD-dependent oxidoreductase, partial [Archaeoglobales archaeon]